MKKSLFLVLILLVITVSTTQANMPDIQFVQGEELSLTQTDNNFFEINIKPEPFTIRFKGTQLNVCAGLDESLFQAAKPETDINKDFKSPFFIFKYAALPETADFIVLYKDGANSLNDAHGAKPYEKNMYQFTVSSISTGKHNTAVSDLKQFFLALWLDKNKDQFIDKDEFLRIKISVK